MGVCIFVHLGTIFLHIPLGDRVCLLSPSCQGDMPSHSFFTRDMVPSQWGMHFYASRDYMHLGTIFLHIPSGVKLCLFSPFLLGGYAFGLPFRGLCVKALLFKGDMVPPQWGMHLYASWDYMHLKAMSPRIPSGGYISRHSFFKGDMAPF